MSSSTCRESDFCWSESHARVLTRPFSRRRQSLTTAAVLASVRKRADSCLRGSTRLNASIQHMQLVFVSPLRVIGPNHTPTTCNFELICMAPQDAAACAAVSSRASASFAAASRSTSAASRARDPWRVSIRRACDSQRCSSR